MTRGNALLIGGVAVAVFLTVAGVLGVMGLFVAVAFLIPPHGSSIFPEWSNPLILLLLAVGVGYLSYKASIWARQTLARRMGAS